jgi:TonB-linked SusC/RagA family outer membrane protein
LEINIQFKTNAMLRKSLLFLLMVMTGASLMAQHTVTGTVTDASSDPIPGVSIIKKGTATGTITDIDGSYSLEVGDADVLVYSFVGMSTQEVPVSGSSVIDVRLESSFMDLDEVVVVGYGVQKKKLVTGATIQVSGEDLQNRNSTNALQALQGQTAGVQISSTSGQPGEGLNVTIRGLGTIGNSGPLYIVDGVQTGDISYLNNADIESIDVLKDAASAAIYGSQAANGVVLITTKTGSKGAAQISFDAYYGVQNVARKMDMLNASEYAVIMNEAAINNGKAPYFSTAELGAMGEGTNWMDEMFYENAITQNYSLGVTGGSDKSVYSLSLSYTGQEGTVGGPEVSNYDRYTFRVNTEHKLYEDIIKVGQNLTFSYVDKNGIDVGNQYSNNLRGAFNASPFLPMYDDAGDYLNNSSNAGVLYNGTEWDPWNEGENNPYASMMLNNQSKINNQKLFGNVYMEVTPLKGLTLRTTLGVDFYTGENRSFFPAYELSMYARRPNDEASQELSKGLALTWDNIATYNFRIEEHDISVMGGMSAYENRGSRIYIRNAGLLIPDLEHAYIDNTLNTDFTLLNFDGEPFDESMLLSYFGRVSYNYMEKYMLNATFRADGSSRFAKNNRWGYFPSVSAGWVMTGESFMDGTQSWMDFLKLRASWGQVGNQSIDPWQYLAPVTTANVNYYFGSADFDASGNTPGAYPSRLSNEDLKWETSEQINIGIDARFLRSRLGLNIDWYEKTTKGWLLDAPILAIAGADAPFINGGNVKNTGVETNLTWNDRIGGLNYYVSGNLAYNQNEVTEVPTSDGIVHGLTNMLYDNAVEFYHRAKTGFPIGYFYGWETNGIFQNEAEVLNYRNNGKVVQPNAKPGDLRYVDRNSDGVINEGDKTMIGDPSPDFVFGFSAGFNIKNFDFSVAANGVAGNQIFQSYRNHTNGFANYSSEILDRWHGEGTSNTIPRVTETNINYLPSDIFVKDGDFLRISNITLGYDFAGLLNQPFVSQARLYASVQNAFTFTKYNGMDPEVGYGLENGSSGVDLGYYPRPRTMLIGVNVKF